MLGLRCRKDLLKVLVYQTHVIAQHRIKITPVGKPHGPGQAFLAFIIDRQHMGLLLGVLL